MADFRSQRDEIHRSEYFMTQGIVILLNEDVFELDTETQQLSNTELFALNGGFM